jgi:hypothetical protein
MVKPIGISSIADELNAEVDVNSLIGRSPGTQPDRPENLTLDSDLWERVLLHLTYPVGYPVSTRSTMSSFGGRLHAYNRVRLYEGFRGV